ncbi:MAG: thiol-disulfide oxidoreductase [Sulfurimonas sp.]|nr:MAG: thiol-disulfide oxidoreductase [Sulfurimonas sp.]
MKTDTYKIILFDGYCKLCSRTIDFVHKRDSNALYKFIPLQSEEGKLYLKKYALADDEDTVVLIEDNQAYTASTAALKIVKNLSGAVQYLHVFIVVPKSIRDFFYKLLAKYRYKLFGKNESCRIV